MFVTFSAFLTGIFRACEGKFYRAQAGGGPRKCFNQGVVEG